LIGALSAPDALGPLITGRDHPKLGHNLLGLATGKPQSSIGHQFKSQPPRLAVQSNKVYLPRMSPSQFARITSWQINADR
jgi:hypothetical protein